MAKVHHQNQLGSMVTSTLIHGAFLFLVRKLMASGQQHAACKERTAPTESMVRMVLTGEMEMMQRMFQLHQLLPDPQDLKVSQEPMDQMVLMDLVVQMVLMEQTVQSEQQVQQVLREVVQRVHQEQQVPMEQMEATEQTVLMVLLERLEQQVHVVKLEQRASQKLQTS
jgi:hypothetical protein